MKMFKIYIFLENSKLIEYFKRQKYWISLFIRFIKQSVSNTGSYIEKEQRTFTIYVTL